MVVNPNRAVFTVTRHGPGWAVEHDGQYFDASPVREEALAAASRRARASHERGWPAQIQIEGEPAFRPRK